MAPLCKRTILAAGSPQRRRPSEIFVSNLTGEESVAVTCHSMHQDPKNSFTRSSCGLWIPKPVEHSSQQNPCAWIGPGLLFEQFFLERGYGYNAWATLPSFSLRYALPTLVPIHSTFTPGRWNNVLDLFLGSCEIVILGRSNGDRSSSEPWIAYGIMKKDR